MKFSLATAVLIGCAICGATRAEPMQRPPPPPPLLDPFFIFFDLGSAELTAPGRGLVDDAARAARQTNAPLDLFYVAGHVDASELHPRSRNRLGCKRARAVRDHLVASGFAKKQIIVISHEDKRPLIKMPDQAERAQNRRAELLMFSSRADIPTWVRAPEAYTRC